MAKKGGTIIKKITLVKIFMSLLILAFSAAAGALISNFFVMTITQRTFDIINIDAFMSSIKQDQKHFLMFLVFTFFIDLISTYVLFFKRSVTQAKTSMIRLTPDLEIPIPYGQKQHGSARFTTEMEKEKTFTIEKISLSDPRISQLCNEGKLDSDEIELGNVRAASPLQQMDEAIFKHAGIPIEHSAKTNHSEVIRLITGDVHTVCFGATRCGKTRTLVIQSIVMQALAGVDMINCDPKGELHAYTSPLLTRLGYTVYALDFKNPKRSARYNFLQFIINAINESDISKAISCCWDFVDAIVAESKSSEPLWTNGEKGLLAAATMQVVYDNSKIGLREQFSPDQTSDDDIEALYESTHKHFQNGINLYNYLSKMSVINPKTKRLLLEDIIAVLPEHHPSKLTLAIAESAPNKTRGSFITSALSTLRLFTDPNIATMTSSTDDGFIDLMHKKAIFIILPDAKQTYYPLASLFCNQYYQYQADFADDKGGRLPRDTEYNLDEFGNFVKIPFFDGKMTVAAGRGIHFHLYLQSKEQLVEKYDKEMTSIILDNCHYWIYLKSSGSETLKLIEERLGKYTVLSTSSSMSMNDTGSLGIVGSGSTSTSTQLMSRSLLTCDEIAKITRPYLLVISDEGYPTLTKSPDLSKWHFNQMLGLGSKDHNTELRMLRDNARVQHETTLYKLWDFIPYINRLLEKQLQEQVLQAIDNADMLQEIALNFTDSF